MNPDYSEAPPAREEIASFAGPAVVEFGSATCGHCRRAQPLIAAAFAGHPGLRHVRVADGPGRPLGRSYRVKLWPTLVFLRDGAEVARLVRPTDAEAISRALALVEAAVRAA